MQKKLLLAGGSHADIPIIIAAKDLGFWVITSGNNPNDLGHQYSDEYHLKDYSRPGEILELAKKLDIDVICPSANDFSAISCAYVAEKLQLPGHDSYNTSLVIHHKDKFRTFAANNTLMVPKAISLTRDDDIFESTKNLEYPFIVKPIDLSGGKGITKVTYSTELNDAVENAFSHSKSHNIVVEEFITGSNHGYSTFLKDGKIVFSFMDDEHYFINPYLVSGASTSMFYTKEIASKLNKSLEKMANTLQLVDGLLHVQFILKDSTPYIIEICRRTPGDLYVKLVEYATAFNMSESIIKSISNQSIDNYSIKKMKYITRHCVMSPQKGIIQKVVYNSFKSKIFDKMVFFRPGDKIENPLTYKAEIDFIQYADKEDMLSNLPSIEKSIYIEFIQ